MSNNPILPVVPNGAAPIDDSPLDDEETLQTNRADLDEGESADSQETVQNDEREAADVNDNLNG